MGQSRYFNRIATFTRPSDTTPYTALDGISDDTTTATAATFTLPAMASVEGLGGIIKSVTFHKSTQNQVGADFDIYFFDTQPVGTEYEDNAAIAITDAEWKRCVGFVSLTASANAKSVVTGDLYCKTNLDLPYSCIGGSRALYYVVVAAGAYTPGTSEILTLRVGAVAN